jgi:hypothetical protein
VPPPPTDAGIVGKLCTNPIFVSSDPQGKWPATGNPYVNNNVWNTAEAGPETIYVCDYGSWYIISNQPDLPNDIGAVKSYPSVCNCDLGKPINSYTDISGTFAASIPQMGEWDVGYDIFTGSGVEVMIQNATHDHGEDIPYPSGSVPVTIDGVAYHALRASPTFIVLLNDTYVYSGAVNILHVFQWLGTQGWVNLTDTMDMIGYGVEISVTESSPGVPGPERFDFTAWSLSAN